MGLFDLLKKSIDSKCNKSEKGTLPVEEKKYYREDSYYSNKAFEGTPFERTVVTFENRKKTAVPSSRGLYPAQILLLHYCMFGKYPKPNNGYPGFWWFEYGIRDVGAALSELEAKGFIKLGKPSGSLSELKVQEIKEILSAHDASICGKKDELVRTLQATATDEELIAAGVIPRYQLTEKGKCELEENAYVPYMHNHPHKTTEDDRFGKQFNVWSINKLLEKKDKSKWKELVDEQERQMNQQIEENHATFMEGIKRIDPKGYKALKKQDQQIEACNKAREKYAQDQDIEQYIKFWENLWKKGGLIFESSTWHFVLPDLYIKKQRYDDAIAYLNMLIERKPNYAEKANSYMKKISAAKEKAAKRKTACK